MESKVQNLKRLVIFLLLAFGFAWIPWIIMNRVWGYAEWFTTSHYLLFANPTLFAPAFANLLTRLITKEGFSDMKLHLRLKGHLPQYLTAWLFPMACALLGRLLTTALYGDRNGAGAADGMSVTMITAYVLDAFFTAPLMAFFTFGEEFGWRGYMNDKMKPLLGTAGTVLLGGALWGIWHAPLTVEGYKFGTDYAGYPYVGFLLMMLFCITTGALLMWLTEKSGSVYPAAVCHAMMKFGTPALRALAIRGVPENSGKPSGTVAFAVMILPAAVLSMVFFVSLLKNGKKAQASG